MSSSTDSPRPRPWAVRLILAAAIFITLLCGIIIWYSFIITPETNCIIAIAANSDYAGHTVEVIPKVAADPDRARLKVKLSEANQYSARFFLNSATYQVRVLRPDGSTVIDLTEFIPPGRRWSYDLARTPAILPPSTAPAAPR